MGRLLLGRLLLDRLLIGYGSWDRDRVLGHDRARLLGLVGVVGERRGLCRRRRHRGSMQGLDLAQFWGHPVEVYPGH